MTLYGLIASAATSEFAKLELLWNVFSLKNCVTGKYLIVDPSSDDDMFLGCGDDANDDFGNPNEDVTVANGDKSNNGL